MEPPRIWKKGERVAITYRGRTVTGRVEMAGTTGRSLMLSFQALLGGFAGHMAVSWHGETSEFRDIIVGATVDLAEANEKGERFCV